MQLFRSKTPRLPADEPWSVNSQTRRSWLSWFGAAAAGLFSAGIAEAARPFERRSGRGETHGGDAEEATPQAGGIPFDQFAPEYRRRLAAIVESPTLVRRMPAYAIECDPDLFLFLVRYPEVVVDIWRLMGVSGVQLRRVGPHRLAADDGAGTKGDVQLVYGTPDIHVLYGEGSYTGTLLRHMTGRCLLVLRSAYGASAGGEPLVTNSLDVFIQIDNTGAEWLAKGLKPVFGRAADYNFTETSRFVSKLSQAAEDNGPGVQRLASRLQVQPPVRERFGQLATMVQVKSGQRAAERQIPGEIRSSYPR